jgi:hypothetical protein
LPFRRLGHSVEIGAGLVRRAHAGGKNRLQAINSVYTRDDPATWQEIKEKGDAAIIGVGH